jgi:oligopeptide/dipeptide ABC transporter ATP-binding protein
LNREPVLTVEDLTVAFDAGERDIEITDEVSFSIYPGEVFGLVGESGCGKTVTALALLKLLPMPGGKILKGRVLLKGTDILSLPLMDIRKIRGRDITMIFQEPSASMNPLLTVERQVMECFDYHEFNGDKAGRVRDLLMQVGFTDIPRILRSFPHELSGGMLQRVMIAMALIMRPTLIIADEPTTALDVTVQAQIMELLLKMKGETGASILLITHNMGLIAQYADRLAVMYAGRIVEEGDTDIFFNHPFHPYSRGLLDAIPRLDSKREEIVPIPGQVPQPSDYVKGCRFQDRCRHSFSPCVARPDLTSFDKDQRVACFLYEKGAI